MVADRPLFAKVHWLGLSILIISMMGMFAFSRILDRHDKKYKTIDLMNKGNSLASLLALHSLDDFNGKRRDFFLRTLTEYITSEGLVYFLIHDSNGRSLLSFVPSDLAGQIPLDIETKSLFSMGLMKQTFQINGLENPVYEFAKPIFEKGQKTGIIRLGFTAPPISWFSLERLSQLAMIALFIFTAVILVYCSIVSLLKPLKNIYQGLSITHPGSAAASNDPKKNSGALSIIDNLEETFLNLKTNLKKTEIDNTEMSTRLGVASFEKKQIIRIIDSLNFGVVITDIQGNVSYINSYTLKLFEIKESAAIDHPIADVLPNEDLQSFILTHEASGKSMNNGQIEANFPEQAPGRFFRASLSFLRDEEGATTGKMITLKDITHEKSTEKTSQDFMANVAHEFLTPLTTIKSYNEMLMDDEIDDREMQKEFYNTISEETGRLTRLIQNLLSISKIQMGALSLKRGLVKTDWIANDSLAAVEPGAQKKQITIQKNLPDNFPAIMGDKELLKTAIVNLLGNAVKYSPENTKITFSLYEQNNMVYFEIIDTGYGISEEDLPHVFEKFYRSKDPNISEKTGSGLGLAMTSEIIHLHSGEIGVKSSLGEGTHFTVSVPKEDYQIGK